MSPLSIKRLTGAASAVALTLALQAPPARATGYHAEPLSIGASLVTGMNRRGDIVLYTDDIPDGMGAWVDGQLVPIPLWTGGRPSDDGRVGVQVPEPPFGHYPGLFDLRSGLTTRLTEHWLTLTTEVLDVNSSGVAVGVRKEAPPQAMVFLGGEAIELGSGTVHAINHKGAVAGVMAHDEGDGNLADWAFMGGPSLSTIVWIPPMAGGLWSEARDVRKDWVAGTSDTGSGSVAFVHHVPSASMRILGRLGGAYAGALAMSDDRRVVGWSTLPGDVDTHAVLWIGGRQVVDLHADSDLPDGWTLYEAVHLNIKGHIVANAIDGNGVSKAFLLTPAARMHRPAQARRPAVSLAWLCDVARPWTRLKPRPSVAGLPLAGAAPPAACRAR